MIGISESLRLLRVVVFLLRVDCRGVNRFCRVALANERIRFGAFYTGVIRWDLGVDYVGFFYFCVREREISALVRCVGYLNVYFLKKFCFSFLAGRPFIAIFFHSSRVEGFSKGYVNYFRSFGIFRAVREFCLRSFIYLPGRFLLGVDAFGIYYSFLRPLFNKREEGV